MPRQPYSTQERRPRAAQGGERPSYGGTPYAGSPYQPMQLQQGGYDAGGPQSYFPDLTTEDPNRMTVQDRTSAYDRGNRIDADYAGELQRRRGFEDRYRGPMDNAYSDLNQTPGYSPEETAAITRQDELSRLPATQEQINSWQFTPEEQAGIAGNPNQRRGYFNPAQTEGIANETAGNVNRELDQWGQNGRGAYSTMSDNTRNAITGSHLAPSQGYMDQQDTAINSGEGNVRRSIGSYGSSINSYMADPQMSFSPQDEANMVQSASTSIGNSTRAARDRVGREAAASGNQSALALASGLNDLQTQGDINAEDAALNAKVSARQLGMNSAQHRAQMGIAAAGDLAGLETSNEQMMARNRLGAAGEREGYRSDSERARMNATLANEQSLGDAYMGLERDLGTQRANYALQTGDRRQDANQFNQATGTQIERDADNAASDRASYLAGNRQQTAMAGQGQYFNQGFAANQAASQRATGVADAGRQGRGEYRGWAADQTNNAAQQGAQARTGRTQAYGTQGQLAEGATQTQASLRTNNPSFGRTLTQNIGASLGRFIGGGR